jgi:hypothetical protein
MQTFELETAVALLARTPAVLDTWLRDLPDAWLRCNEGDATWCAKDVVGHLIHGEDDDWIPRARHVLAHGDAVPFAPFDRFAQDVRFAGRTLPSLLDEFAAKRRASLDALAALDLTPADLARPGRHPALGEVTLRQLLATWVAHDLTHVAQIARVMAKRYAIDVGPWREYLRILQ